MRIFRVFSITVLFSFTLVCVFAQTKQDHPNVIFIAIDDLNDWLGCIKGHPNTKTPHMDKLASQGVLFTNAHCQAPLCGPSRASIMTGLRPSTTGIYGMIDDNEIRKDNPATKDIIFLPEYFKNHGYYTMGIGKIFHEHAPNNVFDESGGRYKGFGPFPAKRFVWEGKAPEGYGGTNTDWGAFPEHDSLMPDYQSTQWVLDRLKRNYEKPFFLAVGYLRPHVPLYAPKKWFDLHPIEKVVTPPYKADDLEDVPSVALDINDLPMMPTTDWAIKTNSWKDIVQAYLACVSFVDNEVGKVLTALNKSKYAKNTIVVLWSDHGYRLGEKGTFAKHALWEEATNAPLIFSGPGILKGKKISDPVEMLSIYPTLLDLCGLPAYDKNEGINLQPLLNGKKSVQELVSITTYGKDNHSIRSKDFRYTIYEDGGEELYDHKNDPNEWNNLSKESNYDHIKNDLKKYFPLKNLPWAIHSSYTMQPYFRNQKAKSDKEAN